MIFLTPLTFSQLLLFFESWLGHLLMRCPQCVSQSQFAYPDQPIGFGLQKRTRLLITGDCEFNSST